MPLPYTFANLADAQMAWLDDNFAALGALTPIPCSVTGTNAVVLTQNADTPTVAAYANYAIFSGVCVSANTGAATAQLSTLGALPIYKDTQIGPVPLVGGEMYPGNILYLIYDSALDSGAGGFHLFTEPHGVTQPVVTSACRLVGSSNGSSVTATWTATELIAETAVGATAFKGYNLSLTFNGAGTGANGMDTGSVPTSAQLAIYAIFNPTTSTWATLGYAPGATAVAASVYPGAHMPSGYAYSALLWVGVTSGSAQIPRFYQTGNAVKVGPTQVLSAAAVAANTYYTLSLSTVVPYSALTCSGITAGTSTSVDTVLAIASNTSGSYVEYNIGGHSGTSLDGYSSAQPFGGLPLLTPQTIYWKSGNTTQTNVILIGDYYI
jgi:hypothetical protein